MGKSRFFIGKSLFLWVNHHFSMGKSPFFIGKSPFFSGCVFQSRSLLGRREVEENRCASSLAVGAEGLAMAMV